MKNSKIEREKFIRIGKKIVTNMKTKKKNYIYFFAN